MTKPSQHASQAEPLECTKQSLSMDRRSQRRHTASDPQFSSVKDFGINYKMGTKNHTHALRILQAGS